MDLFEVYCFVVEVVLIFIVVKEMVVDDDFVVFGVFDVEVFWVEG